MHFDLSMHEIMLLVNSRRRNVNDVANAIEDFPEKDIKEYDVDDLRKLGISLDLYMTSLEQLKRKIDFRVADLSIEQLSQEKAQIIFEGSKDVE